MTRKKATSPKRKTRAQIKKENELKKQQEEVAKNIASHFGEWLKNESEKEEKELKKGVGRPNVITNKDVQKLKACFSAGMNVRETLYFTGVKKSTFYNYCNENPEFMDTIEYLRKATTLQARFNIQNEIRKGSVTDSWKWLEKKCPEEFGNRVGVHVDGKIESSMSEEDREMYNLILQNHIGKKETKK